MVSSVLKESNEELKSKTKQKSLWSFLIATLIVGPLALPMLWKNPSYSKMTKLFLSIGVVLFTIFLFYYLDRFIESLIKYQLELQSLQ